MEITLPLGAHEIIKTLSCAGFAAYAVGGCVRDALMGRPAGDWDITTQARPPQIKDIFAGRRMIDIGERHGTIAIKSHDSQYFEVTTYRVDGVYTDGRRPDFVKFTDDLEADLSRRDFTINAMAYNPETGLIDPFGGLNDLAARQIRCVGDPAARFSEDFLRILRAYRFSATLNFDVAKEVRDAACSLKANLSQIAAERILSEFSKLICADSFDKIRVFFDDIGDTLFPEITALKGVSQNNAYHCFDVYNHTLTALQHVPNTLAMRLAALFHDTGKPASKTTDEKGVDHFHGHSRLSRDIAESALSRLRLDNATTRRVLDIVRHHGVTITADRQSIKRFVYKFGLDLAADLIDIQIADNMAKGDLARKARLEQVLTAREIFSEILQSREPLQIKDLAISGKDIMNVLSIPPSATVGEKLANLMEKVLENPDLNTCETLIDILSKEAAK